VIDERDVFEKSFRRYEPEGGSFERLVRRRDRKRRNQRIAAGVVGIALFVPAIWMVAAGGAFDRTQTPAAPGSETGPTQAAPPHAPASAGPDEWVVGTCNDGARGQLKLADMGDRIKVRFEVHRSPVGHRWLIGLRHHSGTPIPFPPPWPNAFVFFHGTRVASDSGVLAVQASIADRTGVEGYAAYAVDKQTGQVCRASTWF
jgi:hypothetical protein